MAVQKSRRAKKSRRARRTRSMRGGANTNTTTYSAYSLPDEITRRFEIEDAKLVKNARLELVNAKEALKKLEPLKGKLNFTSKYDAGLEKINEGADLLKALKIEKRTGIIGKGRGGRQTTTTYYLSDEMRDKLKNIISSAKQLGVNTQVALQQSSIVPSSTTFEPGPAYGKLRLGNASVGNVFNPKVSLSSNSNGRITGAVNPNAPASVNLSKFNASKLAGTNFYKNSGNSYSVAGPNAGVVAGPNAGGNPSLIGMAAQGFAAIAGSTGAAGKMGPTPTQLPAIGR